MTRQPRRPVVGGGPSRDRGAECRCRGLGWVPARTAVLVGQSVAPEFAVEWCPRERGLFGLHTRFNCQAPGVVTRTGQCATGRHLPPGAGARGVAARAGGAEGELRVLRGVEQGSGARAIRYGRERRRCLGRLCVPSKGAARLGTSRRPSGVRWSGWQGSHTAFSPWKGDVLLLNYIRTHEEAVRGRSPQGDHHPRRQSGWVGNSARGEGRSVSDEVTEAEQRGFWWGVGVPWPGAGPAVLGPYSPERRPRGPVRYSSVGSQAPWRPSGTRTGMRIRAQGPRAGSWAGMTSSRLELSVRSVAKVSQ